MVEILVSQRRVYTPRTQESWCFSCIQNLNRTILSGFHWVQHIQRSEPECSLSHFRLCVLIHTIKASFINTGDEQYNDFPQIKLTQSLLLQSFKVTRFHKCWSYRKMKVLCHRECVTVQTVNIFCYLKTQPRRPSGSWVTFLSSLNFSHTHTNGNSVDLQIWPHSLIKPILTEKRKP